jgi:hypothetical protein
MSGANREMVYLLKKAWPHAASSRAFRVGFARLHRSAPVSNGYRICCQARLCEHERVSGPAANLPQPGRFVAEPPRETADSFSVSNHGARSSPRDSEKR